MTLPTSPAPALSAALATYLDHLAVERGMAQNTLVSYRRDLERYIQYLTAAGVSEPAEVSPAMVAQFLAGLRAGDDGRVPLAASSAARAVVAARGWHKFLAMEGVVALDASRDVHPPSPAKRLPKALPVHEITALIDSVIGDEPRQLRDRAILEFLYGTGARISEVIGLDIGDVDLDQQSAKLRGKGSKERYVPVGSYAKAALAAYVVRGRPALLAAGGRSNHAVFLNARGGRLTRQAAWTILRSAAERSGVVSRVSPHTMRHSFATHLLEGGADIRSVQELLGHASVTTTQVYTLVTIEALREVYATSHPRAR
ncbi:site-specific tyrosine recombinase XerD [Nakamurella antarctica]|uniref:site-specific tyrosine recombinase XerD n=1 Tax=Nakamurella antarctica TaxID=1902245 RepID=UPI0019D12CBE|nr:site-specific tyrosine recombinase XerD [Nakamurella antarctica]